MSSILREKNTFCSKRVFLCKKKIMSPCKHSTYLYIYKYLSLTSSICPSIHYDMCNEYNDENFPERILHVLNLLTLHDTEWAINDNSWKVNKEGYTSMEVTSFESWYMWKYLHLLFICVGPNRSKWNCQEEATWQCTHKGLLHFKRM